MKKIFALSMSIVMLVSMFSGCASAPASSTPSNTSASGATDASSSQPAATPVEISITNSKPEITEALEAAAKLYKDTTGVTITVYETDKPGDYLTQAYAAGDPTTMSLVDYANVRDFSNEYFLDLSNEKWVADGGKALGASFNGKLYSLPFTVEARGLIYNKTAISKLLGTTFNPNDYTTREAFASLLKTLREKGMDNSVVINAEDWSIGSHYLQTTYSLYDGTMDGSYKLTSGLKDGSISIDKVDGFNEAFDTLDLLMEYNYNKADPLAADYDMNASNCADGTVAFWLNGTFAWPDFSEFADDSIEYGVMPLPVSDKSPCLGKVSAAASKQMVVDKAFATPVQQQAALDFLNWLVYSPEGNDILVNKCGAVPAFGNIKLEMSNPFNVSLQQYIAAGNTICTFTDLPSDHRSSLGGEMQKYIAKKITRADLATLLNNYWKAHA